jgi:hypothetical protein
MTAVGFLRSMSQSGELSATSSISGWGPGGSWRWRLRRRDRTSNGGIPTCQVSQRGLRGAGWGHRGGLEGIERICAAWHLPYSFLRHAGLSVA